MSLNTVGIIKNKPEFFEMINNIISGVNLFCKEYECSSPKIDVRSLTSWGEYIRPIFNVSIKYINNNDERINRTILITQCCDLDYGEHLLLKGSKTILTLGYFGDSVPIMDSILRHFDGKKYIFPDDSEEVFTEVLSI